MEDWIKKMPKLKGIPKKMLQKLYERSLKEDEWEKKRKDKRNLKREKVLSKKR